MLAKHLSGEERAKSGQDEVEHFQMTRVGPRARHPCSCLLHDRHTGKGQPDKEASVDQRQWLKSLYTKNYECGMHFGM